MFPIVNMSDFNDVFLKFQVQIERYLGLNIKEIQIDLGGEFMNNKLKII